MKWIINKDLINDDHGEVGTTSKQGMPLEELITFRLKDGDGEVYFIGQAEKELAGTEEGFAPLDDLGLPGYGCLEIEYKEATGWEVL